MFCAFCGKPLNDGAKFCPHCGESTEVEFDIEVDENLSESADSTSEVEMSDEQTPMEEAVESEKSIEDATDFEEDEDEADTELDEDFEEDDDESDADLGEDIDEIEDSEFEEITEVSAHDQELEKDPEVVQESASETEAQRALQSYLDRDNETMPKDDEIKRQERKEKQKKVERIGTFLRIGVLAVGIILLIAFTSVLVKIVINKLNEPIERKPQKVVVESSVVMPSPEPVPSEEPVEVKLNDDDFIETGAVGYETPAFKFTMPNYWENLCDYAIDGTTITFTQKKSVAAGASGVLFSVEALSEAQMAGIGPYKLITTGKGQYFVIEYPASPAYDTNDPYNKVEYDRLMQDTSYVIRSFSWAGEEDIEPPKPKKKKEDEKKEEEEEKKEDEIAQGDYILPQSSSTYLTVNDLAGLSSEQLRYARNEIYARKGRRFDDAQLQAYFDSKPWYHGTIAPEDFNNDLLSDVEKQNAELIRSLE